MKIFAENFISWFDRFHDIYNIFDWYAKHSIKSHEHHQRQAKDSIPWQHVLNSNTILPDKDVIMKSDEKKRIQYMYDANTTTPQLQLEKIVHHHHVERNIICHLLEMLPQKRHIWILADATVIFVLFFLWHYRSARQVSMRNVQKSNWYQCYASQLGNKCYDPRIICSWAIRMWYHIKPIQQGNGQGNGKGNDVCYPFVACLISSNKSLQILKPKKSGLDQSRNELSFLFYCERQ